MYLTQERYGFRWPSEVRHSNLHDGISRQVGVYYMRRWVNLAVLVIDVGWGFTWLMSASR